MMDSFNIIQLIITAVTTLTVGGVIGSIIGLKFVKRKEQAQAKQQEETANSLEINNTQSLIQIYKDALNDLKELRLEDERSYKGTINDLNSKILEYESKFREYDDLLKKSNETVESLTKSQLKLRLEIQSLQSQSLTNCEECNFRLNCERYRAKRMSYEQADD